MKVFLIGSNGQIGKHLVKLLQDSNQHTLKAMVRSGEQANALKESGVDAIVANLEGSVEELAEAMQGSDAVIFSAGSGGKTGPDKTLLVDLDGAVKSMEAAEKVGANRYIMVSAFRAFDRESWKDSPIKPYMVAKHYADRILTESNLNYTIFGPGRLLNEPGTGKVQAGNDIDKGSIPREDVARAVVQSLDEENTFKKTIGLMSGESTIEEAFKRL
ncbi:SDR family oxidoreductase [Oceanobacillus caeni]|uniref:SDR family oxidoreductase n=1 Tax=Bacillaceae TaxID=186817 RepID=UPI000621AADC|nr:MULTISPECIES: SDR family oxidoreductase [Bacillaceae]KKE79277.1 sugar epimerase [Bacilli bacterium VT-13-104]PZD86827.1 SDR family NAD(P)-dependent oxidoreductase [Bacilli bacterium]MCR1833840.1 SDR family oxidoreductase [Oceanobacillus caeni]MED4475856.1 SDR family oxidoreductase [Oceanobacillus caeni]PZD88201.1 SDR family NAD(P)-dependent oxidoreductase [Bacilli bacterium]